MIPSKPGLLHVYDTNDLMIDMTASIRRNALWLPRDNIHPVGVKSVLELRDALDEIVEKGLSFPRALFETHGSSGTIYFGPHAIKADTWRGLFGGRGYERIF